MISIQDRRQVRYKYWVYLGFRFTAGLLLAPGSLAADWCLLTCFVFLIFGVACELRAREWLTDNDFVLVTQYGILWRVLLSYSTDHVFEFYLFTLSMIKESFLLLTTVANLKLSNLIGRKRLKKGFMCRSVINAFFRVLEEQDFLSRPLPLTWASEDLPADLRVMLSTRTVPTDQRLLGNLLLSTGSGTELSRTSVTMVRGTSRSPVPGYDGTNMMWSWNTNGYDKSGAKTKHLSPDIILECLL